MVDIEQILGSIYLRCTLHILSQLACVICPADLCAKNLVLTAHIVVHLEVADSLDIKFKNK